MVRETRHLWVGNLPENIREDRIRDHFKRYGRVQSVKLLPRGSGRGNTSGSVGDNTSSSGGGSSSNPVSSGGSKDEDSGGGGTGTTGAAGGGNGSTNNTCQGLCATVSFMDIKSAAKAHHSEQKLDDRTLTTEYHEPAAIPGGTSQLYSSSSSSSQQSARFSSSHGSSEEVGGTGFDRSSHFYDRSDSTGGGSVSTGSASGSGASNNTSGGYLRRGTGGTGSGTASAGGYHPSSDGIPPPASRSRTRDRLYRNGPYPPLIDRDSKQRLGEPRKSEGEDLRHSRGVLNNTRSQGSSSNHHRVSSSSSWGYDCPSPRYSTNQLPATTPELPYSDERRENTPVVHKKHSKSSISRRSGSDSGSNSGSSRSRSSSASSQSGSSTCSTASSSPAPSDKSCSTHSQQSAALRSGGAPQSTVSSVHTNSNSPAVHSEDRRPLAICVRNLPARSSDTSLKDGLYHEYKKHGKVTWVKVVGQGVDRYALVCFKKPDDVDKALQVSHDKLFFGCKIEVAPYQGYDVDDNEFRPFEAEQDEFHPKATRTLFIGNLEKDTTAQEIRKHFEQFGEIIDIDVKKQGTSSTYAFCQFSDISSVVRAMRTLDGEHVGQNRIKLGFGKSMHTNSVWVDGVADSVSEKYLSQQFGQFGPASHVVIDRSRGHALVFYEQIAYAQQAVKEMRGVVLRGRKLQVDYASRECQEAFYDRMDKQANSAPSSSSPFDNSVQTTAATSVNNNLRVFDTTTNTNTTGNSNTTGRYSTTTSSNTISSSTGTCGSGSGSNRYSGGNPSSRSSSTYVRSNSSTGNSPATGGAQPTVSTLNQGGIRTSSSRQQVNTTASSSGQRFDYSAEYVQDRRSYRSYEDGVGADDPGGGPTSSEVRHLQKERLSGLLEGGGTSPAAAVSSAAVSTVPEEGRRRCNKHRRSESTSGNNTTTSSVGADAGNGAPSRPGTPLCDERPENLPVEPRRTPRDRSLDPLSLPLPRFAAQVLSPRGQPPRSSPPASPSHNFSSSDSEPSPPSPEWEERLRSLDERYEKWSGSRSGLTKIDPSSLKIRHKLLELDVHELPPSDIVKSVLAKRSVFDEDSKRLENFGDKYEPKEFIPAPRTSFLRRLSPVSKSPGLQYPFPSHPPVQPTTSVATTTAPTMSVLTSATEVKPSVTFLNCTRPQHIQPKISSPSIAVAENTRSPVPTVLHDKFKPKVKTEQPVKKETPSTGLTPALVPPSAAISTPPKPKSLSLRRDSADEKSDAVRRKSRDESVSNPVESGNGNVTIKKDDTSESDKVRDAQVCERRKSVSAVVPDKRRSSVDNKTGENICDTGKHHRESTDKKEDRRRGSSELSEHQSPQPNTPHHKADAKKLDSVSSDNQFNCIDINEKNSRKSTNENIEKRKEGFEHNVVRHNSTEVQDKKKDVLGVSSERDRRRARESTDSSHDNHSSRHNRKVPENKKEIIEPSSVANEKRDDNVNKASGLESSTDKKRDSADNVQPSSKHREKKEHHTQEKEKRRDSSEQSESKTKCERISPENTDISRHKEQKRTSSEQNVKRDHEALKKDHDNDQKISKKEQEDTSRLNDEPLRKEPETPVVKHKDSERRRNSENEISKEHSLFKKVFGFAESLRHHKERRDSDTSSVKTEESSKHRREHSTDKEKRKDKEVNDDGVKHKSVRKSPDNPDNSRHKEEKKRHLDANSRKIKKEYDNADDTKLKEIPSDHSDLYHSKSREDKKKEERKDSGCKTSYYSTNEGGEQITKCRDAEKKKDFTASLIDIKKMEETDNLEVSKKESDIKKETDTYYERRKDVHSDVNRNKESERRKSLDKYYENEKYRDSERKKEDHDNNYKDIEKKNDTNNENIKFKHIDRHRDNERKRDHENLENCRMKDSERKRDFESHERHKSGEKKKDTDRLKEEKKNEDGFDALKHKENERKIEETYDRIKTKEDNYNRFRDYIRKKESDSTGERKKDAEKERRKERDHQDIQTLKESLEERKRESEKEKKRNKEYELHEPKVNGDHDGVFTLEDCRKSCVVTYDDSEHRVDSLKKEKRRERNWPATIGCKRRLSSQDSLDINDDHVKRSKPERRDSKDSGRSSGSSRKGSGEKHSSKGFKLLEEKIKEDKEREQRKKEEALDNNSVAVSVEDKIIKPAIRKEKRNSGDKRKEEKITKFKSRPRENGTASESDLGSGDDETKAAKRQQHSIFDIVDDEPAYISMYDKVKARSTKNMQKQEEEKRQEKLKEKFHQLKASRAKREEKKRSTSYDEDSDSEKGSCRRNKLLLTSSEEDGGSESDMRMRARKILYDTSEDDTIQTPRTRKTVFLSDHPSETKCNRKIVSDVSEDDTVIKHSTPKVKSSRNISFESEIKSRKIMSDTSEDDATRHNSTTLKLNTSRIQSDESEADLGFEDSIRPEPVSSKDFEPPVCDIFSNRPTEVNHFTTNNDHQEQVQQNSSPESLRRNSLDSTASEQPRKKSHKKKQKRQKTFEENEEGSIKKHSSKKDKKKSHRDNDGEDEKKSRKKRSDREGNNKIDEKFEDIFGSLSDDSEKTMAKWQVSHIYDTDSESERENIRKKEKKRREKKLRELDEAGRALEAKLMDNTVTVLEEPTKVKKKKRKKSRDEKIKHHQQRVEQEEAVVSILPKEEADKKCSIKMEPDLELVKLEPEDVKDEDRTDLPHLGKLEIKIEADSEIEKKPSLRTQSISSLLDSPPPTAPPVLTKKPDIPGFGSEVDESIHETAVKSISESPRTALNDSDIKFEDKIKTEEPQTTANEEKPTPVISQEETEDAVAALLVDAFGGGFEGYTEDTPKPDTPVSEPDLQIDTDTEDPFDTIDFSKPPRTPDIPASYYTRQQQNDTREGLEERIMSLACSADSPLKDNKPLQMPRTPDVVFDKKPATPDIDMSSSDSEKYPDKQSVVKNLSEIDHPSPNREESSVKEPSKTHLPSVFEGKVPEFSDHSTVPDKAESQLSHQKTVVADSLKNTSSTQEIDKVEEMSKDQDVPKLTLLIPQNVSTIQTTISQHSTGIPSLSPITKSSEMPTMNQTSNTQSYQKVERIQQVPPKAQTTVLVQQPQPQTAQVLKSLNVQVINSPAVAKSSEQTPSIQIPPNSVHTQQLGSPKQIAQNPQTQNNLIPPSSKQSNVQNKPTAKTIIIQQSPPQTLKGPMNTVQVKPQPQPAQHSMPAQHATAAQHAILKPASHRLPVPYPPIKTNQNMANAHPHLVQSSTTHLIPIKVNPPHQSQQSPVQTIQSVGGSLATKEISLSAIKDPQNNQQATTAPSNNAPKQLQVQVSQGQNSPQSPQPLMSPQNLKLVRPVSATQPPPLQSISVHHFRSASHFQQAPPRSPNPSNVPLLQTVNVSGDHAKSSKSYMSLQVPAPLSMVNCHNLMHSPNNQTPHPEKVLSLSPSMPLQTHQQPHSPGTLAQKISTAVNVIKSSGTVNEQQKVAPLQENSNVDVGNKEEKNQILISNNQSPSQLLQVNSMEHKEAITEQNVTSNKNVEQKKSTETDDSKPLNAVIQDLTLRAASKAMWKQSTANSNNESVRQEPTKPIEQVVLALHKKATAIPQPAVSDVSESVKEDNPLISSEIKSDKPKLPKEEEEESSSPLENKLQKSELPHEQVSSSPQTPIPNSNLDLVSVDPNDHLGNSPSERNVSSSSHTSSSSPAVVEEKNQIEQTSPEPLKTEAQAETMCATSEATNITLDKKSPMQQDRKSPTPPIPEKKPDRKTPSESSGKDDEGPEPKAPRKETTPEVQVPTDDKTKPDVVAPITPITTRPNARGGRRRKGSGVGSRGGSGVATRRTRLANSAAPSPISTDIYEFRDDAEEERPRLILTIKSPPEPAGSTVVHSSTTSTIQQHENSSTVSNASTPTTTTRKSRRLQEKDGSRTTIDDTIDDVVRGNRPGRRTTRSSAQSLAVPPSLQTEATRKSPRRRQQAQQQQQQQQQPQSQQRQCSPVPSPQTSSPVAASPAATPVTSQPATLSQTVSNKQPSLVQQAQQQQVTLAQQAVQQPSNTSSSSPEPTTLIDPVTGLLIPMTESEEGQYVPLHSETNRTSAAGVTSASNPKEDGEPAEKRARLTLQPTSATLQQPTTAPSQPPPPVPVQPQQQPQQVSSLQERTHPPISVVSTVVPPPTVPTSRGEEPIGRTATSNSVTTAAVTVPTAMQPVTPSRPSVVRPIASHSVVASHGMLLPQGKMVPSQAGSIARPPLPSTSISHNPPPLVVSMGSTSSTHQTRLSSNVPSSSAPSVTGANVTSVVPKAHLLQAPVGVRPSPPPPLPPVLAPPHGPPVGMPVAPKAHLLQVVGSSGAREGIVGSGTPHQGAMLTGSVASPPPLRAHQQPVVTGASSARVLVKDDRPPPQPQSSRLLIKDDRTPSSAAAARLLIKEDQRGTAAPVGGGAVPPTRVLVKESGPTGAGCIVGIAGSPQPPPAPSSRNQVLQAGMPVPAYEASLGDVVQHVGYGPHHIQPAHYVHPQLMYQQYLREAALGGPYNRPLGGVVKTDLDDRPGSAAAAASALVASPPLELRRGSPHDRTTDSPQVATVYMHHGAGSRHHVYYDGPPPPPAHRPQPPPSQSTAGRLQTPPHAGQAPPQADSLLMLLQRYPVMWQGLLALKNDQAAVQMHFVFGNHHLAQDSLPHNSDGSTPPLRIAQRMRLEQTQVEGVARKMQIDNEHCMLLALPCGRDHMDVLQQSTNLQSGFITYLQQKQAAGIVNIAAPGSQQAAYVVHIFPACEFANESLARIAPDLLHRVADLAHLLIVIATV